uniref:Uncharacterized protein n=1 Tax=Denticeps clupeoides TaxID=299321 RepID=A0AAY4D4S5_9TELE
PAAACLATPRQSAAPLSRKSEELSEVQKPRRRAREISLPPPTHFASFTQSGDGQEDIPCQVSMPCFLNRCVCLSGELELAGQGTERRTRCRWPLPVGTTWGPFPGRIETGETVHFTLSLTGGPRWLQEGMCITADSRTCNCVIYCRGGQLWCTTIRPLAEAEELKAVAMDTRSSLEVTQVPSGEGPFSARLLDSIQLLPQQASIANILPNAIINKDIFPCKACGIWFRSDRNLQAHLMYYCSGRHRDNKLAPVDHAGCLAMPCICPFPQCNMSFSGTHTLEVHLLTHSSKSSSWSVGPSLKCSICQHSTDTLMSLQQHMVTHLSQAGLKCDNCAFTFQTADDLCKHQNLHLPIGDIVSPKPGPKSESFMRKDLLQSPLQVKDAGPSVLDTSTDMAVKADANSGNRGRVKSEPPSPRQASSPMQPAMPPAFPISPFVPHVHFPQDISAVPQASEILAKMSELVHRRLHQGANNCPPLMYNSHVQKGTTCFECNITFNNLDNYLVHKKHYCSSRWQRVTKPHDYPSLLDHATESACPRNGSDLANMLAATPPSEVKAHAMDHSRLNLAMFDPFHVGEKAVADDLSTPVKKASTPGVVEERLNGIKADSKSPNASLLEGELGAIGTTCEACKITFSRHETYMVHKQYYCATRHDPPAKRSHAAKGPSVQKMVRARKRRKRYDVHAPAREQMLHLAPSTFLGMAAVGGSCLSQPAVDTFRDQFHARHSIYPGTIPKYPEASLTVAKSALPSKANAAAQPEADVPMDLSKKCKAAQSPAPLPLDYHECAPCKLSFNKVEDYLTHKHNFCPGVASDRKMLQDRSKESSSPEVGRKTPETPESVPNLLTREDVKNALMPSEEHPSVAKRARQDEPLWPYCEIRATDQASGQLTAQGERRRSPDRAKTPITSLEKNQPRTPPSATDNDMSPTKPEEEDARRPPTGSTKYCRPCDIQFSNLSNFITHKKFYCSSHTAEHVK